MIGILNRATTRTALATCLLGFAVACSDDGGSATGDPDGGSNNGNGNMTNGNGNGGGANGNGGGANGNGGGANGNGGGANGGMHDGGHMDAHHEGHMMECEGGDEYMAGMEKEGLNGHFTVVLVESDPEPMMSMNYMWTIEVLDENGDPVSGADINATPFMPAMGHGVPDDLQEEVTDNDDGTYTLMPVALFMGGLWEVTIDVEYEGDTDSVTFSFCLTEGGDGGHMHMDGGHMHMDGAAMDGAAMDGAAMDGAAMDGAAMDGG